MQTLFKSFFEHLIDGIVVLIVSGVIVHWTIDMQLRAANQGRLGLVSLTRINQQLVGHTR